MKTKISKIILFVLLIVITNNYMICKEFVVYGKVIDSVSKQAITAATVKILESTKGTYTNNNGIFKINLFKTAYKIAISSIGYKKTIIDVPRDYSGDTIFVKLQSSDIKTKDAIVIGDIEPDEIIKRAIAKKNENKKRLKTLESLIYSKLYADVAGSLGSSVFSDGNSVGVGIGDKKEKKPSTFLLETYSKHYEDAEKNINYTKIVQRRQTANLDPSSNIFAVTDFMNFLDEEIVFIDTHLPTPLCNDALDYYNFYLVNKQLTDDKYVYNLTLKPKNSLNPGFEGSISIIEGTYELIDLNIRPTAETAIQFIDSLNFVQKYSNVGKNIWYPTYLEVSGRANVDVVRGLVDLKMDLKVVSIVNEIEINRQLPDSIYLYKEKNMVKVDTLADSVKADFWDKNALTDLSPFEKQVYKMVDSNMAKIKSDSLYGSPVKINFGYYIDFNRVGSLSLGLKPEINLFGLPIKGNMYYSIGQKDFFGDFDINFNGTLSNKMNMYFGFEGFSKMTTMSFDNKFDRITNTIVSALFHTDYYDFYKKDGLSVSGGLKYFNLFDLKFTFESSRQTSLVKTTDRTLFSKSKLRDNPQALEGSFSITNMDLKFGKENSFNPEGEFNLYSETNAFYGEITGGSNLFKGIESMLDIYIPLIRTGYKPIGLDIMAKGAYSDDKLPAQYQFRMKTSLEILGKYGNFYTANPSEFGGMRYFELHTELELTDYFYRALKLPLYEGRGLNLSLYASTGQYYNSQEKIIYKSTEKNYYTEIGFGISRIPIFISNVIFLEFQARWGLGPLAGGRFGWSIGIKLPF